MVIGMLPSEWNPFVNYILTEWLFGESYICRRMRFEYLRPGARTTKVNVLFEFLTAHSSGFAGTSRATDDAWNHFGVDVSRA